MRFLAVLSLCSLVLPALSQDPYMFVGTYTSGKSKGIYVYRFHTATGQAELVSTTAASNPSYLALSRNGNFCYAASEGNGGNACAYAFDKNSGKLQLLNCESVKGADPCYVSTDSAGKWLFTANYSSGSLTAFPLAGDGSLKPASQILQHEGKGVNAARQEKAHVHSTILSPDEKFLLVADLGLDREYVYRFDPTRTATPLRPAAVPFAAATPGSGPRHIAFHPSKPIVYLVEELTGHVQAFAWDAGTGGLKPLQDIKTTTGDFHGDPGSADIHVSADGRFVYATNRGDANSLAVFSVGADGLLSLVEVVPVKGKHPRNFVIDPSGKFLLVANRDTDNVVVFAIDGQTGKVTPTGTEFSIPNPVCVKFLP